ncbi:MAG: undecaprenyl-phosphate glucose phosphotransferase [Gammaproteobacteria bacterium]
MFENVCSKNQYGGFIKQNKRYLTAIIKMVDISIIVFCFLYLFEVDSNYIEKDKLILLVSAVIAFEILAVVNNLYNVPRGVRFLYIIQGVTSSWFASSFVVLLITNLDSFVAKEEMRALFIWLLITPILILSWHLSVRTILRLLRIFGRNSRRAVIVGATSLGKDLAHIITHQAWMGFNLIGFFDDRAKSNQRCESVQLMGTVNDMVQMAKKNDLDVVFITLPMAAERRIKKILDQLSDTTTVVYFLPNLFVFDLLNAKVENFNGMPAISVFDTPHHGIDGFSKRFFDIVVASIILVIIAIPMLIIAIGIKLTSPGPVLFVQRRYGLRGEEILVWKFRTMQVCENGDDVKQATKNDTRVTSFGEFLRRTSLDELPQFINVLQGRMSIVGPRPHAVVHNEFYRRQIKGYMLRHNVKPGITGLAQIRGFRGETDTIEKMQARVRSDLEYIHSWSIWLDLEIFVYTIVKGFTNKNAY